jgi:hypothetical protein
MRLNVFGCVTVECLTKHNTNNKVNARLQIKFIDYGAFESSESEKNKSFRRMQVSCCACHTVRATFSQLAVLQKAALLVSSK